MTKQEKSPKADTLAGLDKTSCERKATPCETVNKCPHCRQDSPLFVLSMVWLDELAMLLVKHSGFGIGPDVPSMSIEDKWGLFVTLRKRG